MGIRKDITGQRFGKLIVKSFDHMTGSTSMWRCKCDCGGIKIVSISSLLRGSTKSCGCLARKAAKNNFQYALDKYNLNTPEHSQVQLTPCKKYTKEEIQAMNNKESK